MNPSEDPFDYIKRQNVNWRELGYNPFHHRKLSSSPEKSIYIPGELELIDKASFKADKLGVVPPSNIQNAVTDIVKITGNSAATTTLDNAEQAVLTSTLTDNLDANRVMLAVFHVTPFAVSVDDNHVVPYGSSITPAQWLWYASHDWNTNNNRYTTAVHMLRNLTAGNNTDVFWRLHWRYIGRISSD